MSVGNTSTFHCQDYHIEHGTPDNSRFCALALAITAQCDGVAEVSIDGAVEIRDIGWEYADKVTGRTRRRMKFQTEKVIRTGRLNAQAIDWMIEYDRTGKGTPIDFEVTFS